GRTGYFSSARASGENRHDIYRLKPGAFERMAKLVVLYGVIKVDDQIAGGVKILFEDAETGQLIGTTESDTTGQFNYGLLPGNKYKITMNVADAEPHVEYIEVDSANFFVRIDHEFNIYTFAYLKLREQELDPLQLQNEIDLALRLGNQRVADSLSMILKQLQGDNYLLSLQREIDEALRLGNKEVADSLTMVLRRLMGDSFITDLQAEIDEALRLGEQEKADSLTMVLRKLKTYNLDMALQSEIDAALQAGRDRNKGRVEPPPTGKWRVQIGAYRYPGKFNYQFLRGLGEVEIKTYPDGITRYLLGRFDVKADAEAIRDKAIKLGQTDAWVTLRD
ncbi:MAG: SPOR domain-containing protein, partial [Bacteroidota bacterium]